jgi:oligoribonuclease (3'-5' exoribonuclease)
MSHVIAGLDGEMSGTRPSRHRLIQIGVCVAPGEVFTSSIGWDELPYDGEALSAVGLTVEQAKSGPPAADVDADLYRWLTDHGVTEHSMVVTGWRVSTFDIPFVVRTLPTVTSLLSHHTVELNALCYAFAGAVPYQGRTLEFQQWKQLARQAAETYLGAFGIAPAWHDAGFDAQAALVQFAWLRGIASGHGILAEDYVPDGEARQ